MGEGIEQGRIVRSVTTRLYDDVFVEAKEIPQGKQLFLWRVDGRVFAFRCVRKTAGRAKNMTMRVNAPRRRPEIRCGWVGVKRDVGRIGRCAQNALLFRGCWNRQCGCD